MWRLFFPLHYFALVNSEKRHLDLWPTLILGAAIAMPFVFIPHSNFFHDGGLLDKLLVLTSALTGFYIAALVAVATFPNPDLDKIMTVGAITRKARNTDGTLSKDDNGKPFDEMLTRREFSCAIFGYLAFSAFVLSLCSVELVSLSKSGFQSVAWLSQALAEPRLSIIRGVVITALSIVAAHLVVATCLGLYYLMARVYRRDPQIVAKKQNREAA